MIIRKIRRRKKILPKDKKTNVLVLSEVSESTNSLMIALIICANFIALTLDTLGIASSGIVPIVFGFSLVVAIGNSIIAKAKLKISRKSISLFVYILIAFALSVAYSGFDGAAFEYLIMFTAYGGLIFFITLMEFDSYKVIKYVMIIGILFLINPLKIAGYSAVDNSAAGQISMGASYAFFPCVVAAILHFFYYRKRTGILITFGYLANAALLFLLLKEATRGVLLSLVLLCFYIFFAKIGGKFTRTRKLKLFGISVFLVVGCILLLVNLESILLETYNFMDTMGFEVSSVIKTYGLVKSEGIAGVLNGRGQIYVHAFEMIKSSPIWGSGIGAYYDLYGTYPHNLFLQMFVEGGLLLLIPISVVIFQSLFKLIKAVMHKVKSDRNQLLILLFIVAIPRLMLSSYLWREQTFWLLIFIFLASDKGASIKQTGNIEEDERAAA